jgi:predicted enzyme related to lactoylglutathione lyase
MPNANAIVWCDIPVKDLDRAVKFYTDLLGKKVTKEAFGEMKIGLLPHEGESAGGCLILNEKPSADGPMIYLNCDQRLDPAIASVEKNGGRVLQPKHQIGPHGFRAIVLDSEGNRIALHSK